MGKKEIINHTIRFVKKELTNAEGGHDWFHIDRVRRTAKTIAKNESVDPFIVELGALLHDIADAKFYDGDETVGNTHHQVLFPGLAPSCNSAFHSRIVQGE